jgi:hypothetical protein
LLNDQTSRPAGGAQYDDLHVFFLMRVVEL